MTIDYSTLERKGVFGALGELQGAADGYLDLTAKPEEELRIFRVDVRMAPELTTEMDGEQPPGATASQRVTSVGVLSEEPVGDDLFGRLLGDRDRSFKDMAVGGRLVGSARLTTVVHRFPDRVEVTGDYRLDDASFVSPGDDPVALGAIGGRTRS